RFDAPWSIGELAPPGARLVASRGVRILIPAAAALRVPVLGSLLRSGERALCDSPLRYLGGVLIAALQKASSRARRRERALQEIRDPVLQYPARAGVRIAGTEPMVPLLFDLASDAVSGPSALGGGKRDTSLVRTGIPGGAHLC